MREEAFKKARNVHKTLNLRIDEIQKNFDDFATYVNQENKRKENEYKDKLQKFKEDIKAEVTDKLAIFDGKIKANIEKSTKELVEMNMFVNKV